MALHPQGLPDLRHSCLDLRRAHDAQPRHAAVLVLDERTRLDDPRLGQHRQAQAHLDLLPGVAQHGDTTLARRNNRNPPAQGGWNLHNTNGPAATIANPAVSFAIRMNGQAAWPGWPTDAGVEEQVEAWIMASDAQAQAAAMKRLQELAWEAVPFAPTGLFRLRTAFRRDLEGVLQGPNPFVWNLRRA